jgi:hypothetical protein
MSLALMERISRAIIFNHSIMQSYSAPFFTQIELNETAIIKHKHKFMSISS